MHKKNIKRDLCNLHKFKPNWDTAIKYAEKLIRECDNEDRKYRLGLAIKWFKFLKEIGEPWPGEDRKQRPKKRERG
jgi:hypothetical protein